MPMSTGNSGWVRQPPYYTLASSLLMNNTQKVRFRGEIVFFYHSYNLNISEVMTKL